MFWVISVYFNIRNTLPESGTFLLGHPVYLPGWGLGVGLTTHTVKIICSETQQSAAEVWKSDLIMTTWDVRTMLIAVKMQEISKEIMKGKIDGSGSNAK